MPIVTRVADQQGISDQLFHRCEAPPLKSATSRVQAGMARGARSKAETPPPHGPFQHALPPSTTVHPEISLQLPAELSTTVAPVVTHAPDMVLPIGALEKAPPSARLSFPTSDAGSGQVTKTDFLDVQDFALPPPTLKKAARPTTLPPLATLIDGLVSPTTYHPEPMHPAPHFDRVAEPAGTHPVPTVTGVHPPTTSTNLQNAQSTPCNATTMEITARLASLSPFPRTSATRPAMPLLMGRSMEPLHSEPLQVEAPRLIKRELEVEPELTLTSKRHLRASDPLWSILFRLSKLDTYCLPLSR
ncbi:hypothetical protein FKP32DRAFT_1675455 [Trametes sanguinea]|nr:hypothetical protein FKP32DRAFT_1675455 [Trametes sanguinea]